MSDHYDRESDLEDAMDFMLRVSNQASLLFGFDSGFIEDLQFQLEEKGQLSNKQWDAVENIWSRFDWDSADGLYWADQRDD